jgi:hypothetical protein
MMNEVLNDEDAQRKGVVGVSYNVGPYSFEQMYDPSLMNNAGKLFQRLPIRCVGFHYCFDDMRVLPAVSLLQLIVGTSVRLRFRVHCGKQGAYSPFSSFSFRG